MMADVFTSAFCSTFRAVLQIFIVVFLSGVLVRRKIISQEQVKALSAVTVVVLLPCMIFSSIIKQFEPSQLRIWPVIPLTAVAMIAFGLAVSAAFFIRELPEKKNMLALSGLQNAAYLILPVGSILFRDEFDKFELYCFLYILGLSPLLWSVGKYLISSGAGAGKIKLSELITPPFVANVLGLMFVFTHTQHFVPAVLRESIELVGSATVPVATLILGAGLGGISFRIRPYLFDMARVALVKMILIPAGTIVVLYFSGLNAAYPVLAGFFVLQASSAPATAAIIQVKHYGGDENKIGSIILVMYILCILEMPFWVAVWKTTCL